MLRKKMPLGRGLAGVDWENWTGKSGLEIGKQERLARVDLASEAKKMLVGAWTSKSELAGAE